MNRLMSLCILLIYIAGAQSGNTWLIQFCVSQAGLGDCARIWLDPGECVNMERRFDKRVRSVIFFKPRCVYLFSKPHCKGENVTVTKYDYNHLYLSQLNFDMKTSSAIACSETQTFDV